MMNSATLQVLLELVGEEFITAIRSERLKLAPCAFLKFLDEIAKLLEHLTLVTDEAHPDKS